MVAFRLPRCHTGAACGLHLVPVTALWLDCGYAFSSAAYHLRIYAHILVVYVRVWLPYAFDYPFPTPFPTCAVTCATHHARIVHAHRLATRTLAFTAYTYLPAARRDSLRTSGTRFGLPAISHHTVTHTLHTPHITRPPFLYGWFYYRFDVTHSHFLAFRCYHTPCPHTLRPYVPPHTLRSYTHTTHAFYALFWVLTFWLFVRLRLAFGCLTPPPTPPHLAHPTHGVTWFVAACIYCGCYIAFFCGLPVSTRVPPLPVYHLPTCHYALHITPTYYYWDVTTHFTLRTSWFAPLPGRYAPFYYPPSRRFPVPLRDVAFRTT